jgi:hypothetical protein
MDEPLNLAFMRALAAAPAPFLLCPALVTRFGAVFFAIVLKFNCLKNYLTKSKVNSELQRQKDREGAKNKAIKNPAFARF